MPALPSTLYFPLAPDWVCEVLSPATAKVDRAEKLPFDAREGVRYAWLVDPVERLVEVLRLPAEGDARIPSPSFGLAVLVGPAPGRDAFSTSAI